MFFKEACPENVFRERNSNDALQPLYSTLKKFMKNPQV